MKKCFGLMVVFLSLTLASHAKSSLVWQIKRIPMQTHQGQITLEALLVTPQDQRKHPIALINHGSPRNAKERLAMDALYYLPIAKEFAQRGYAVAFVLRRGYGSSGGGWAEGYGKCNHPNYLQAAHASAEDLHAVIRYLSQLPSFDTNNILAVGYSAGGFATLALSAFNPPQGLKAAIVFAPGRGSYASEKICKKKKLVTAFSELGKTSRVPMLWVYAENDHFFTPKMAHELFAAFIRCGGRASFLSAPAFRKEGHFLFSNEGIAKWVPIVDKFLGTVQ